MASYPHLDDQILDVLRRRPRLAKYGLSVGWPLTAREVLTECEVTDGWPTVDAVLARLRRLETAGRVVRTVTDRNGCSYWKAVE